MPIFLVTEDGGNNLASRVINGRQKRQPRTAPLQPIMVTAVNLQQHTRTRPPLAARAMLGATMGTRTRDAGLLESALHCCP